MPIKFRCKHCRQFLGISRSKAGSVTDCPTCGRTIRVPNLDGKVAAIPKPKLDLQDSELIKALGALASINGDDDFGNEQSAAPILAQKHAIEILERDELEAVVAEPIDISVLPEDDSDRLESDQPQPIDENLAADAGESQPANREAEVLAQLSEIKATPLPVPVQRKQTGRFGPGSLLIGCVTCLICGGLIGRALFPKVASSKSTTAVEKIDQTPQAPQVVAAIDKEEVGEIQISGKLTYTSATGEALPDREARILILPMERMGSAKLSVAGFRVGASPADKALLKAELHSLGGDFAIANSEGEYTATLPQTGRYGVIIASRYQARSTAVLTPGPILDLVAAYFERPSQLLGKVQFHFQTVSLDASGEVIDKHFEVE